MAKLIEINISNLAAVPSIIYGLMALGVLVYQFHFGQSILAGGLTLTATDLLPGFALVLKLRRPVADEEAAPRTHRCRNRDHQRNGQA